jgi:hypothetical protein
MWDNIARNWDYLVLAGVLGLYVVLSAVAVLCLLLAVASVNLS